MADLDRIKRNVQKMASQNAPMEDIDGYIATEGVTIEQVKNHKFSDKNQQETTYIEGYKGQRPADIYPEMGMAEQAKMATGMLPEYAEGMGRSIAKGATFARGDKAIAGLGAIPAALATDLSYEQAYNKILADEASRRSGFEELSPMGSVTGELMGGVGGGAAILKGLGAAAKGAGAVVGQGSQRAGEFIRNIPKGVSDVAAKNIYTRGLTSSGLGAGGASLYEHGETGGVSISTPFIGAGVGALGTAIGAIGQRSLTNRVRKLREYKLAKRGQLPAKTAEDVIPESQALAQNKGELLTLTKGEATKDVEAQAIEEMARRGGLRSDDAKALINEFDALRQKELRSSMAGLGADMDLMEGEQALLSSGKQVRQSYKALKNKVNKAYEAFKGEDRVLVNAAPIRDILKPQIKELAFKRGFDYSNMSDKTKDILGTLLDKNKFDKQNITSVDLQNMEFWRRKLTNQIEGLPFEAKAEKSFLRDVRNTYDDFMDTLPDEALKAGDTKTIDMLKKARGLRKEQGVRFERNNVVRNIVENDDLTNEEIANIILTGKTDAKKINNGAGRTLKAAINAVDEAKRPEFIQNLKKGMMSRILQKSKMQYLDPNSSVEYQVISPEKLRNQIDEIMMNKTFVDEIMSKGEQKVMNALARDLRRIAKQPGAVNYSNTAYTLMRFFEKIPVLGKGLKLATEPTGNFFESQDMQKALSNMIGELSGTQQFYGAGVAAPATNIGKQPAVILDNGEIFYYEDME